MVRPIAFLAGIGFCVALLIGIFYSAVGIATAEAEPETSTAEYWHEAPRSLSLASDGAFGRFDRQQLQRGLKVYQEVCAACHSLSLVAFRDFEELGYNEDQVKALAAAWPIQTPTINPETGEPAVRPGQAFDRLPAPYANEVAARAANNNANPPDLSLITKARAGGADYIYSLLTGYRNVPADLPEALRPGQGLHYNPSFHSLNIAMPAPLHTSGQVTYDDGTPATVDQMARDVSAFLVWTAEPELAQRHRVGWVTLGFLLAFTVLAFLSYRSIWADKKGH